MSDPKAPIDGTVGLGMYPFMGRAEAVLSTMGIHVLRWTTPTRVACRAWVSPEEFVLLAALSSPHSIEDLGPTMVRVSFFTWHGSPSFIVVADNPSADWLERRTTVLRAQVKFARSRSESILNAAGFQVITWGDPDDDPALNPDARGYVIPPICHPQSLVRVGARYVLPFLRDVQLEIGDQRGGPVWHRDGQGEVDPFESGNVVEAILEDAGLRLIDWIPAGKVLLPLVQPPEGHPFANEKPLTIQTLTGPGGREILVYVGSGYMPSPPRPAANRA